MEEITNIIETYRIPLRRLMKTQENLNTSTVTLSSKCFLKKPLVKILWVLFGVAAFLCVMALVMPEPTGRWEAFGVFAFFAVALLLTIRRVSYEKIIYLDDAKFEFKGYLRKRRVYTLAEYAGAETLRTIKDFPEKFVVRFKTEKGEESYKLADLNTCLARNIQPNYEAVTALWDAIIKAMTK